MNPNAIAYSAGHKGHGDVRPPIGKRWSKNAGTESLPVRQRHPANEARISTNRDACSASLCEGPEEG